MQRIRIADRIAQERIDLLRSELLYIPWYWALFDFHPVRTWEKKASPAQQSGWLACSCIAAWRLWSLSVTLARSACLLVANWGEDGISVATTQWFRLCYDRREMIVEIVAQTMPRMGASLL